MRFVFSESLSKKFASLVLGRRRCSIPGTPGRRWRRPIERLLPNGPLLDFFWSWRFLVRELLAVICTPLPKARVFHAVATGFSGLVGQLRKAGREDAVRW